MTTPAPAPTPIDNRDIIWKVIGRFDAYIAATNTKAAGVGAIVAFVVGTIVTKWTDLLKPVSHLKPFVFVDALLLGGLFLGSVFALFRSIQAVTPDRSSPQAPGGGYHSRIFFEHVAEYGTPEAYLDAVRKETAETALEDHVTQAHALARILTKKFAYLDDALWWLRHGVLIPSAGVVAIWAAASAWAFLSN